jgi:MFS family permease
MEQKMDRNHSSGEDDGTPALRSSPDGQQPLLNVSLQDMSAIDHGGAESFKGNEQLEGGMASSGGTPDDEEKVRRRNIRMMFALQVLNAVAYSTAFGPVFDRYLYYLGGGAARGPPIGGHIARNSLVGVTESVSGISTLVFAAPIAMLVDWRPDRRARLLRVAGIVGIFVAVLAAVAVVTDVLLLTYLMLVVLGLYSGLMGSASEAIFADSIPRGKRANLFTTKAILGTIGFGAGPLLSACGLYVVGDQWQPYQMKAVILFGALLTPISCIPLFFFKDPAAAGASESSSAEADNESSANSQDAASENNPQSEGGRARRCGFLGSKQVPVILALSDFITCIGAGMTVKFFNLFFIVDEHFSPTEICWLQTAYPLVIALFTKFTERLSKPFGRAQASLLFFSSNVICLFLMSGVKYLPILLAVFLVRGGFANSTYPIDRSILMDFTPSSRRGLWNAVENFTSMTWSGSAVFGGLLADSRDYRFTFFITGFVYATACVIYCPLLFIVPRKEEEVRDVSLDGAASAEVIASSSCP